MNNHTGRGVCCSLLALLALLTLATRTLLEWRYGNEIAAHAPGGH